MSSGAEAVDAYVANAPDEARPALEKIRKVIQAAAPEAEEALSYQIPTFKQKGSLVAFGVGKNHVGFYVMSEKAMEAVKDELKDYDTAKSTIRFPFDQSLPNELITKIVKARVAENEAAKKK